MVNTTAMETKKVSSYRFSQLVLCFFARPAASDLNL